jgi:uncharacterized UBP type Zn finger protein
MPEKTCDHLSQAVEGVAPSDEGCSECLDSGGQWVHLRMCMVCGHVGCCDSSSGKHATRHFVETGHNVMQSFEPGETWGWCYEHERYLGPFESVR